MIHFSEDFAQRQHCDLCAGPISVRAQLTLYNDESSKKKQKNANSTNVNVSENGLGSQGAGIILSDNHFFLSSKIRPNLCMNVEAMKAWIQAKNSSVDPKQLIAQHKKRLRRKVFEAEIHLLQSSYKTIFVE